ncbi:hypothetical protein [Stenotrophomonas pavanii]|uniref:hypothetical protein n=1 Tax=Stenotrophomonas pavanii TaxID=487698 RepID=UPI002DBD81E0|nr:hypothetical protein [Stenotrophomonas pavanii]MEC4341290.1 hypothetical protein [Stenotrophomonas pavanii]
MVTIDVGLNPAITSRAPARRAHRPAVTAQGRGTQYRAWLTHLPMLKRTTAWRFVPLPRQCGGPFLFQVFARDVCGPA